MNPKVFLAEIKPVTQPDHELYSYIHNKDAQWCGSVLRSMLRECIMTRPFHTIHVGAIVGILSIVGSHSLNQGRIKLTFEILSKIHKFCNSKLSFYELTEYFNSTISGLNISQRFVNGMLACIKANASAIKLIEPIPEDTIEKYGTGPEYASHERTVTQGRG